MILLKNILFERINSRGIEVRLIHSEEEQKKYNEFLSLHYLKKGATGINIPFGIFYNTEMVGMFGFGNTTFW